MKKRMEDKDEQSL